MTTKKRQVLMRFQPESYDKLRVIASINRRSITNQVEFLVDSFIKEYEGKHGQIPLIENNVGVNNGNINNNITTISG